MLEGSIATEPTGLILADRRVPGGVLRGTARLVSMEHWLIAPKPKGRERIILSGNLRRDEVRISVKHYINEHDRMFPTKYRRFGDSPLVSLDEAVFDDGSTTRGDTVSRGLWD